MGEKFFPIRGGLDQETPAIGIPPGRVLACLNHEMQPNGAQRTEGFERFDGQPAPSAAEFLELTFTNGSIAFAAGDTITGNDSMATARVLDAAALSSGTFGGGDAAGTLGVHLVDGVFSAGEIILVGVTAQAIMATIPVVGDWRESDLALAWLQGAQTYARNLIAAVPGSGAIRGILYYAGALNVWRDSADATLGTLYHSTIAGWALVDLGQKVTFDTGGPYQPSPGEAVVGDQSGATATIRYIALDSGDWAFSDAGGVFILDDVVGTLGNETISSGPHMSFANLPASPLPMTFPPGGRYEFDVFNFYATESFERAYGANGVSQAFEFDGASCTFITTGMVDDRPFLVGEHKNQLFLGFRFGSLQNSIVGSPRDFSGRLGAAELGLGHELTNLIPNNADVMLIFTDETASALTGNDSSDFNLSPIAKQDAGAKPHTAQRIGDVIYLDNRGVRSATTTQIYANFRLGTYTSLINKELKRKRKAGISPVASCVVKTKSQYLLFFDDGSGISIFFGLKQPEAMLFSYPFVVSCLHLAEVDGEERLFVGCTDGFVRELNKGTSFDGDVIEAFIQLPYGHQGAPRVLKRYTSVELELNAEQGTMLGLIAQFDGGSVEQPFNLEDDQTVQGGGGLWGIVQWGEFIWSAPQSGRVEYWVDGMGSNMSPIFVSRQSIVSSYTIPGVTVGFRPRGTRK